MNLYLVPFILKPLNKSANLWTSPTDNGESVGRTEISTSNLTELEWFCKEQSEKMSVSTSWLKQIMKTIYQFDSYELPRGDLSYNISIKHTEIYSFNMKNCKKVSEVWIRVLWSGPSQTLKFRFWLMPFLFDKYSKQKCLDDHILIQVWSVPLLYVKLIWMHTQ